MATIIIPDDIFSQIMTCMGGRFLEESDLEIPYDDIKDTLIVQAYREYFRWYPIESTPYTIDVSGPFEVAFPDTNVFSVMDVRMNTSRLGYGPYGNALVDERFIRNSGAYGYGGKYGTANDYGFTSARIINRFEKQSTIETNKAFKWNVNEQTRKLVGFSNTLATLSIIWASWSNDWQFVGYSQQRDVVKLSQAFILRFFGELRSQDEVDGAPITLNADKFIERADKLEEEVMVKWRAKSSPIIMRN